MTVRKIVRMGHPVLRQRARELTAAEIGSDKLAALVDDMVETLHDSGGIGLAAPQIDEAVCLAIIDIPAGQSRYGDLDELPLTVFVNPRITVLDESRAGYWEGCLSVPGLRGFVERPQSIRVSALDLSGRPISLTLQGFNATVFQHEFDHLQGLLFVDHVEDNRNLLFEEEFLHFGDQRDHPQ